MPYHLHKESLLQWPQIMQMYKVNFMLQLIIPWRPLLLTRQATQSVGDNCNDSCNQLLMHGFYITTKHLESRDLNEIEETSCFTLFLLYKTRLIHHNSSLALPKNGKCVVKWICSATVYSSTGLASSIISLLFTSAHTPFSTWCLFISSYGHCLPAWKWKEHLVSIY